MGWEIANIHCGSPNVGVVRRHLRCLTIGFAMVT
jgi:hypothetical protein